VNQSEATLEIYSGTVGLPGLAVEDMNHEQSTSSIATTRMKITRGIAYSVFRAIEVIA